MFIYFRIVNFLAYNLDLFDLITCDRGIISSLSEALNEKMWLQLKLPSVIITNYLNSNRAQSVNREHANK